jgi:hypothetical protein
MSKDFVKWTGLALCVAAVITFAVNAVLTPMLPQGSFSALAASQVFLVRQSFAAAAALLLIFGIVGLHVSRLSLVGGFGTAAFVVALCGGAGLFSVEWNQLFTIRDFALHAPDALGRIEDAKGLTPFDLGSLIAASTFFMGWLLLAVSLLLSNQYSKLSAGLILAGFIVAPALSALGVSGAWPAAGASAIIGAGWFLLGVQMMKLRRQQV